LLKLVHHFSLRDFPFGRILNPTRGMRAGVDSASGFTKGIIMTDELKLITERANTTFEKLDYFVCSVTGALFAYLSQHYESHKIDIYHPNWCDPVKTGQGFM
jgi:hypothetical protein